MDLEDVPATLSIGSLRVIATNLDVQFAGTEWKVRVFDDPHEGPAIYFTAKVVDSYDPEKARRIGLYILSYLSPNDRRDTESFLAYVLWRLKRIAIHEVGEGLKLNGELIWNPHDVVEPRKADQ